MKFLGSFLFFILLSLQSSASVDVLLPGDSLDSFLSAADCKYYFLRRLNTLDVFDDRDDTNHIHRVHQARQMIVSIYRQFGTVSEDEIKEISEEEKLYPAGAVLYFISRSDTTDEVEAIARTVTTDVGSGQYYNDIFSARPSPKFVADAPVYLKNKDEIFRNYFRSKYKNVTEIGRVGYGKGVNEFRALIDILGAIARLAYQPGYSDTDHYVIADAVAEGIHRYEELGLKIDTECPITFKGGRKLMARPMLESYNAIYANVKKAETIEEINQAIKNFSPNETLQKLYTFGIYNRALVHYTNGSYAEMLEDAKKINHRNPRNSLFRKLELFAEAFSRAPEDAIRFLNLPTTQVRFAPENLHGYPHQNHELIQFVKGLMYIRAKKYKEAKAIQLQYFPKAEYYGKHRVSYLKRNYPAPEKALEEINKAQQANPTGLSSHFYFYVAQVLEDLNKTEEAETARKIAEALQ